MQKINFLVIFLEASLFRFRLTLHRAGKIMYKSALKIPFLDTYTMPPAPSAQPHHRVNIELILAKSPSQEKKNHELRKKLPKEFYLNSLTKYFIMSPDLLVNH